jgi:phosphonate transport system substrate-binding protein
MTPTVERLPHSLRRAERHTPATLPRPLRIVSFLAPNLLDLYQYLARAIEEQLDYPTELTTAGSYAAIADADVAFLCSLPYVEMASQGKAPVEPLAAPVLCGERYGGRPIYFSDVIVRHDSPFQSFADLRGRSWAYNEPRSQSGYGITRQRLLELGETSGYFSRVVQTGWHERSLRQVLAGEVDASAIDSHVLAVALRDEPQLSDQLRVIDSLGPSTIQPVVVSTRLPDALKAELRTFFLMIADQPRACQVLRRAFIESFVAVDDSSYDDIRVMRGAAAAANFLELK